MRMLAKMGLSKVLLSVAAGMEPAAAVKLDFRMVESLLERGQKLAFVERLIQQ